METLMPSTRYTTVARALHWVIAVLIILQIIGGFIMHKMGFSDLKIALYQYHKSFGFVILALSLVRLGWRFTHPKPALPDGMKGWEKAAASFTHIAFYALMIGIPLVGWAMVSADPLTLQFPTKLFFTIPVPNLPLPVSEALSDRLKGAHELLAKATVALLVLHIGAALKHHFVNRDDVLSRMLPGITPKSGG